MSATDTVTVSLACHHTVTFAMSPPMLGESIYCVRCRAMRRVEGAPAQWRMRCMQCTTTRNYGDAREDAERAAARHRNKRGHRVGVYNGRKRVYVIGGDDRPIPRMYIASEPERPAPF